MEALEKAIIDLARFRRWGPVHVHAVRSGVAIWIAGVVLGWAIVAVWFLHIVTTGVGVALGCALLLSVALVSGMVGRRIPVFIDIEGVCNQIWIVRQLLKSYDAHGRTKDLRKAARLLAQHPLGFDRPKSGLLNAFWDVTRCRRFPDGLRILRGRDPLFFWIGPSDGVGAIAGGLARFRVLACEAVLDENQYALVVRGVDGLLSMFVHALLIEDLVSLPPSVARQKEALLDQTADSPVEVAEIGHELALGNGRDLPEDPVGGGASSVLRLRLSIAAAALLWLCVIGSLCWLGCQCWGLTRDGAFTTWMTVGFSPVALSVPVAVIRLTPSISR